MLKRHWAWMLLVIFAVIVVDVILRGTATPRESKDGRKEAPSPARQVCLRLRDGVQKNLPLADDHQTVVIAPEQVDAIFKDLKEIQSPTMPEIEAGIATLHHGTADDFGNEISKSLDDCPEFRDLMGRSLLQTANLPGLPSDQKKTILLGLQRLLQKPTYPDASHVRLGMRLIKLGLTQKLWTLDPADESGFKAMEGKWNFAFQSFAQHLNELGAPNKSEDTWDFFDREDQAHLSSRYPAFADRLEGDAKAFQDLLVEVRNTAAALKF